MTSFQILENGRILVILLSSLTFIVLSAFSGNLVQPIYGANFGAAGDWGCNSNTEATVSNMDAKNPQAVFGLGDYSYVVDDEDSGDCWFSRIDPEIDNQMKIAIGNHEDDSNEGFQGYMDRFGLSQTYYSYDQQDVHVLVMDTDRNSFSSGSSQYNFIVNDLQQASQDPDINWIIAYLHKPMYTSPTRHTGLADLRDTYHPLFDQYGVDLVLQGHNHNYQRTFPLKYDSGSPSSPTITSNNANTYTNPEGQIFAIVGTGGVGFYGLSGKASFVSNQQDDFFGQLDIRTSNGGNTLEGKFYRNGNNAILDSFSITKVNNPPVANNQVVFAGKDTAKTIFLSAPDPDDDPRTYSIVASPQHGTLSGTGNVRTYTPTTGYTGSDSFTFRANDGTANSNTATVSISVVDPASCPANLPVSFVEASGNDGNVPANVLDNNLNTRWSNPGVSWIAGDLGLSTEICSVDIAWYLGNQRQYGYAIVTSTDGNTWNDAFSGTDQLTVQLSSGTTANSVKYFIPPTNARFFAIVAVGVTNSLVGITEVDVFGSSASLLGGYQYDPSLSLSGPK